MALKDPEWRTAYTAAAGQLSATAGSSSGTPVEIETKNMIGVEFRLGAVNLPTANKIYLGLAEGDAGSTTLWKTVLKRNGSWAKWPVAAVGDGSPPFPCRTQKLKVVPYLDTADTVASATIQYRRISPSRI